MSKILIVYFSRTGYTKRVAEQLAHALGAAICPIEEDQPRRGVVGYVRSFAEALLFSDVAIKPLPHDPAEFDLVVIGSPVWGWHISSPSRAFARRYRRQIKRAAFFCTMGGAGAERAFDQLQRALGIKPVATLELTDREIDTKDARAKIKSFASVLRASTRTPRPASRPAQRKRKRPGAARAS